MPAQEETLESILSPCHASAGRLNVRTSNDTLGGAAVKSNVPADPDNDVVCLRPAFRVVVNRLG